MVVRVGDRYPVGGAHAGHEATIVAVDWHGVAAWEIEMASVEKTLAVAPTVTVACSCGRLFVTDLDEAVAA